MGHNKRGVREKYYQPPKQLSAGAHFGGSCLFPFARLMSRDVAINT